MGFDELFKAFVAHPGAAVAVGEALAIGYLFRELQKANASNLQTALSISPVAAKLAEGVEALERMLERVLKGP